MAATELAGFDALQAALAIADSLGERVQAMDPGNPAMVEENLNILREFGKIAAGMLQDESSIQVPGSEQTIPVDPTTVSQALNLFLEGILFSIDRCRELSVQGEVKTHLLQNLAMDIYNQAKQVVASTYGQESTPEFQFTFEQQVQFICQGAESALLYYVNEFEKQNGPIAALAPQPEPAYEQPPGAFDEPASQEPPPAAPPELQLPAPMQAEAERPPEAPGPNDKYAAVALLLGALNEQQGIGLLRSFNEDERAVIEYYGDSRRIERELDVAAVKRHLKRFRELLKSGSPNLTGPAYQGIAKLSAAHPAEALLNCVSQERSLVRAYVEAHLDAHGEHEAPWAASDQEPCFSEAPALPPRIEEALHRHLSRQLGAAS